MTVSQPGLLMAGPTRSTAGWPMLTVLFHLLWRRELFAEGMAVELLGSRTVVRLAGRGIG
ncbi:hypothetical protein [Streptomyces asiaticus]